MGTSGMAIIKGKWYYANRRFMIRVNNGDTDSGMSALDREDVLVLLRSDSDFITYLLKHLYWLRDKDD